jgi:cell pole-organizing protein PopZ
MTEKPNAAATPDGGDPSMEDILASIRRILNEEEAPPAPGAHEEAPAAGETPADDPTDDDVLVLDPSMMVSSTQPGRDEPEPEAEAEIAPPTPHVERSLPKPEVMTQSPQAAPSALPPITHDLVAPEAAAAAASSVGSLVRTLAAGRSTQVYSGGPTLEDLVRAELRPLLKEWLDANLPPLVERLVRAEIERVVGREVP